MDSIKYPILPNGWIHGFMSDEGNYVTYPINGLWKRLHRLTSIFINNNLKSYVKFTKQLCVETCIYKKIYNKCVEIADITICPIKNSKIKIKCYKCGFCMKYHAFLLEFGNNFKYFAGKCYQPLKFVKCGYFDRNLFFKPSLRSRVTSYARNLKKNTN